VNLLLLKLVLTPSLIALASLAGRKWGHAVSGWIVALPLTTGPIVFFLALSHGAAFAADTAAGILAGGFSLAAFVIVYGRLAARWTWLPTLAASSAAFLVATALLRSFQLPILPLWISVLVAYYLAFRSLPHDHDSLVQLGELPAWWDIPLRMVVATGFVVLITSLATRVGPHLAGLLSPFPFFTATMAAFAQHQYGSVAAVSVLRGLLLGLFSFASFMFALSLLLIPAGVAAAFAAAILVVFVLQAASFWLLRRVIG
jgi:hypothetical protein